ncbi:MAG: protein-arginine deiminase family protein [Phycisphaerales bacterium]
MHAGRAGLHARRVRRRLDDPLAGATGAELPAVLDIADGQWHELGVEARGFPGVPIGSADGPTCPSLVTISAVPVDQYGISIADCAADLRTARIAPWMMTTHLDTVTTVYVTHGAHSNNPARGTHGLPTAPDFHQRVAAALVGTGASVQLINSGDPWPQDQWEIGFTSMPSCLLPVVMNSPRQRSDLREYVDDTLSGPGMGLLKSLGTSQHTQGSFGNLECLPAYGGATARPLGELYHGNQMPSPIPEFLEAQPQQPWSFSTSWLRVQHVDEIMAVRPTGDGGFHIILASPRIAIDPLQAAPDDLIEAWAMAEPQTPPLPGRTTARILAAMLPENEQFQMALDGLRSQLQARGLVVDEVPVLFRATGEALLPDMVNLLCVNGRLIVPKPFYQPFEDAFRQTVGVGVDVLIIDCLERHGGLGQVHCGTNTRRSPKPEWAWWWEIVP